MSDWRIFRAYRGVQTAVSAYDRFNAILVSLIMLVGVLVALLFNVWWSNSLANNAKDWRFSPFPVPNHESALEEPAQLDSEDLNIPAISEFNTPDQIELMETLEQVTHAVSAVQGALASVDGTANLASIGGMGGADKRDQPEDIGLAPSQWSLEIFADDIDLYRQLLDQAGIKLGAVSLGSNRITTVGSFTSQRPQVEFSNRKKLSQALRFEHKRPQLLRWDVRLVERAGVETDGCAVVQFVPSSLRRQMRTLEQSELRSVAREYAELRRTVFSLKLVAGRAEIAVDELLFHNE